MRLVILEIPGLPAGTNQTTEFELKNEPTRPFYVVGRQLGSDIHLVDSSVSRKHAELTVRPEGLLIRDLGSANGSFIAERQVQPYVETLARPGQRVRFGNVVLSLEGGPVADYFSRDTEINIPLPTNIPPNAGYSSGPAVAPSYAYMPQTEPVAAPVAAPAPVPSRPRYQQTPPAVAVPPRNGSPVARNKPKEKIRRSPALYTFLGILAGLVLLAIIIPVVYFVFLNGLPQTNLPPNTFSGAARQDRPLGLVLGRPSDWLVVDSGQNQTLYYPPNQTTTVLNVERPPSRTVPNGAVSPENAIKQYVANVKASATRSDVTLLPSATKLKDGTPAVLSRLVFTTNQAPIVTDYNMLVISFKCGSQLYFVSAAAEGVNNTANVRRDLDASIANLECAK